MNRVKDKVIIITGAALGIGRATSLLLAREGALIAVTDVQDRAGQELVEEIRKDGGVASYWHLDVSRANEVREVLAAIKTKFGRIDVLVNNAGIAGADKPTDEISEDEWDQVIAINIKGVFLCIKHAIPALREAGGGSIINLSSIYGIVGAPDLPAYHASKGAVRLMTKTDALLYAKENIRVNSVHPGFIRTPFVDKLAMNAPQGADRFNQHLDSLHPMGHCGEPDDVAYGILYLASDESKFVTGSELVIDGGYTSQ